MLHDDVWRLEKIGKDGAFHKKLTSEGIKTVQDFLKLSVIDLRRLRKVSISISCFSLSHKKKKKILFVK